MATWVSGNLNMPNYDLKSYQESATFQLQKIRSEDFGELDWKTVSRKGRQICDYFLALSASCLLVDLKPHLFFTNACRAAENWRRWALLGRKKFQQEVPLLYHLPVLAALVADDTPLIKRVHEAMPRVHNKGEEYEQDFITIRLFYALTLHGFDATPEVLSQLDTLEGVDSEPNRTIMFKALLGEDELVESDFWSAFENALIVHEEMVAERVASATTSISQFIAARFIWFEGLVWLKLAKKRSFIQPSASILYCPDEALIEAPSRYNGDWQLIPLLEELSPL